MYRTPLPGGYSFDSNGGWYGHFRDPSGIWLADHFGIQNDGSERWCNEFGWSGTVVVCALELVAPGEENPVSFGYYVLDTKRREVSHAPDLKSLSALLKRLSVPSVPSLTTVHPTTETRR